MKSDTRAFPLLFSAIVITLLHGCGSSSSSSGQQEPPPDTTAPTVGAVQTPEGSSLNRTVTLSVSASDNVGVAEVRFFVDGDLLASDTSAPYSVDWDTSR